MSASSTTTAAGNEGCAMCGEPTKQRCSACKTVYYCSQTCQRKHWMSELKTNCKGSSGRLKSQQHKVEKPSSSIALVPSVPYKLVDKVLFLYDEFVKLFNWDLPTSAPCGLLNFGNRGSVSGAHPQAWSSTCRNYHSWRSFGQEGHPSSCLSSQTCQRKHWMSEHQTNCKGSSGSLKSQQLKVEKPSSSIALVPSVPHKLVDKVLFSYDEFVKLFNWDLPTSAPCGFLNCGNR